MKVSVIIPLYNKSATIARTLRSVRAQTFRDFELIVVDDGSTDDGASKATGGDVRLIGQANAGPGAARNHGIRAARGQYLAFLDADDEWLPDYLAESVRLLDRQAAEVASVTSGYYLSPSGLSRADYWRRRGLGEGVHRLTARSDAALAVAMLAYMSPCTTVVRADIARRWSGFYERDRCRYAEDAFLWLKVLLNHPVVLNMRPLARFHVDASELSANLKGARPVEPFLERPEDIEAVCPSELRGLLSQVLAIRAQKTACVLGYWGEWQRARAIAQRFRVPGAWRLPYFWPAQVCATPVGGWLGQGWRRMKRSTAPA